MTLTFIKHYHHVATKGACAVWRLHSQSSSQSRSEVRSFPVLRGMETTCSAVERLMG